ncbi:MAG: hypothetical protein HC831_16675 [Chloroflexia bacterium]|nr:hypothetical protein [Chloroflexia bacterium]
MGKNSVSCIYNPSVPFEVNPDGKCTFWIKKEAIAPKFPEITPKDLGYKEIDLTQEIRDTKEKIRQLNS